MYIYISIYVHLSIHIYLSIYLSIKKSLSLLRGGVLNTAGEELFGIPLPKESGTYKTIKARSWPWSHDQSPDVISSSPLSTRMRTHFQIENCC